METLDGKGKVERLPLPGVSPSPILFSGKGGIKLLGVPALPYTSTEKAGSLISEASMILLSVENVTGMVFDTTSSKTGSQTAACVSLQLTLERPLLWFACRHHVGEIILSHVWDALNIEAAKSPEISIFQRFKENFDSITYRDTSQLNIFELDKIDDNMKFAIEGIVSLC